MKVCPVCQREYPQSVSHCDDDGVALVALTTGMMSFRAEELVGQTVEGRYKVERIIGKGGMGTVYACRHVVVGKTLAMKVLRVGADKSEDVLQRFVREAQMANLVRSRHIIEITDFGQLQNGAFFVVMELLEGFDLSNAMRERKLDRAQMIHVFAQIASTLQLAHDKGIVHRDLKPDNVFLVNESGDPLFVKLLDFGIAKIVHGDGANKQGLTETGVILGTPYYMSPEQARAEQIDHRSDIYSLGVMMYRAFTGKLPFMADSTMGVLTRHITDAPEPPSKLNVDPLTERLILRCMEKRRDDRFQNMSEVVEALNALPKGAVPAGREEPTVYDRGRASSTGAANVSGAHGYQGYQPQQGATGQHGAYPQRTSTGQQQAYTGQQQAYPGQQPYAAGQQQAYPGAYATGQQPAYTGQQAPYATGQQPLNGAYTGQQAAYPQRTSTGQQAAYTGQQASHAGYAAQGAYATGQHPQQAGLTGQQQAPYTTGQHPAAAQVAGPQVTGSHAAPPPAPSYPSGPGVSGAYAAANAANNPPPTDTSTTRGVVAVAPPPPAQNRSTMMLVIAGVLMAVAGAAAAVAVLGGPKKADGATASSAAVTPAPSQAATAAAPSPTPSASASAPASATADATAPSAKAPPKALGPAPKATPTATATSATPPPKRPGVEIRSPFD